MTQVFGIGAVLYVIFMAVLLGLAAYVLILVITFLRLRIAELKRTAPPKDVANRSDRS